MGMCLYACVFVFDNVCVLFVYICVCLIEWVCLCFLCFEYVFVSVCVRV